MDSHNDSTGFAAVHTSSPFPSTLICEHVEASSACWLPNGANRSQPALSLLSPVALEGKPSSEAKATSPQQIPLLCHSAGMGVLVSERVRLPLAM
ncbi:hypothetical protein EXN66_Car015443 [Channa argus]|uniref:Uncharacterized protein n=1 Tax=Channa argus TaxID=215402 RepID=A0A6G1QC93_CHAAH|nr:hypothetical protein EXN66_Car015443 [Channa argus]